MAVITKIVYDDALDFTFDSSKIEIVDDKAKLKFIPLAQNSVQNFDNDTGFTYDSAKVEFAAGELKQISQISANSIMGATFTSSKDLSWSKSDTETSTDVGSPILSGGKVLLNADQNAVYWEDVLMGDISESGSLKVKFSTNYSGSPASDAGIITNQDPAGTNKDKINIFHGTDGDLKINAYDSVGALFLDAVSFGAWTHTAGAEQTFELIWDWSTFGFRLFLDGVQLGGDISTGANARGTLADRVVIGSFDDPFQDVNSYEYLDTSESLTVPQSLASEMNGMPGYAGSLWFKTGPTIDNGTKLLEINTNVTNKFHITLNSAGTIAASARSRNSAGFVITNGPIISKEEWHHVVVSTDLATQQLNLFIDGVKHTLTIGAYQFTTFNDSADPGNIGNTFVGFIDEVSLYNDFLTDAECVALYNSGSPNNVNNLASNDRLIHWYRMGEGNSGALELDQIGSIDLPLVNMTSGSNISTEVPPTGVPSPGFSDGIFDDVFATSDLTQDENYTVEESKFSATTVNLPVINYAGAGEVQSIDSIDKTGANPPADSSSFGTNTVSVDLDFADTNTMEVIDSLDTLYTGQIYPTDNPTILTNSPLSMTSFVSMEEVAIKNPPDTIRYQIKYNSIIYYFVGSTPTISDGTYDQANTIEEVQAGLLPGPIDIVPDSAVNLIALLHSEDGSFTPQIESNTMGYNFIINIDEPDVCIVTGRINDNAGRPVVGATVLFDTQDYFKGELMVTSSAIATTDDDGNFSVQIIETETVGVKVDCTITYIENNKMNQTSFVNLIIPNKASETLSQIVADSLL